jgi:phospho-N-acetylmuramoyl-pentapeptide-transferase
MIYFLTTSATDGWLSSVGIRSFLAFCTAFFIAVVLGKPIVRWLGVKQKKGQPLRDYGPTWHAFEKSGTPTMGGVIILLALIVASVLWIRPDAVQIWAVLALTCLFGLIGFVDDLTKIAQFTTKGLSARIRLLAECLCAFGFVIWVAHFTPQDVRTQIIFPFFGSQGIDIGIFFFIFSTFIIVGAGNAVNFTDGLDGLATTQFVTCAAFLFVVSAIIGGILNIGTLNVIDTFNVFHIPNSVEFCVLLGAAAGAGLGFLWYNAQPAQVFMGDTGSLAIGGFLGSTAVALKQEIVFAIIAGVFVMEAISVILQIGSFRLRKGKRIFLMAPIHHHFEKLGWKESLIISRFWIISVVLGVCALTVMSA